MRSCSTLNSQRSTLNAQWKSVLGVGRFLKLVLTLATCATAALYSIAHATSSPQALSPQSSPADNQDSPRNLNVLILGDSLSLCGFGKRLDQKFRADPRVKATYTYITCGTNPLSWLKEKPYAHVQTHCGFWSIESLPESNGVKELPDVYGMSRGHRPKSHPVPKLEDLLKIAQPDILVMQTGGNLFGLFAGRSRVRPESDAATLRKYILPFVEKATEAPSRLRKIYWVSPPVSGRVSGEVQAFVFDQTQESIGNVANVIDSRSLVSYPYKHMEPDHEHFIGEDMDAWADKVFEIIDRDLSAQSWSNVKPLSVGAAGPTIAKALPVSSPSPAAPPTPPIPLTTRSSPPAESPAAATLIVRAKLVSKSKPIRRSELLPYQEFLVGFIYDVQQVIQGDYSEKQILVMHPAFIGLKKQSLWKYHVGHSYQLQLRELEGSLWSTVKSKDDSGRIDLQPYIRTQDETRYPENSR